jgi:hypothetical protein
VQKKQAALTPRTLRVLESSFISLPKIFSSSCPITRSALLRNDMSSGRGEASAESKGTKMNGRVDKLPDLLDSRCMVGRRITHMRRRRGAFKGRGAAAAAACHVSGGRGCIGSFANN